MLRRGLLYAVAALLVLMAVGSGIASQLLPLAERNPDAIARWLSARAQRPVAFDAVETEWTRRGPLLRLDNLRVGGEQNPLRIGDAEVLVSQYGGLLPGRSFTELRVRGLDLTLERDPGGRWRVRGLPGQQQAGDDPFATLERLGELQVSHASLHVLAPDLGVDTRLPRIDLRMRVDGPRIRGGANAWLREGTTPFTMALEFDRDSGNGRVHAGTGNGDLRELAGVLSPAGMVPASGRGRVQAWGTLEAGRIVALHTEAALQDVALRGAPLAGEPSPVQALGRVQLDARWRGSLRQWRADAASLRIGTGAGEQVLDGVVVLGGREYGLRARRIDAAPLLALLSLSDVAAPGLRRWLQASAAGAVLEDVELHGVRGGPLRARARVRGLHFAPVGNSPGLRGVDGDLLGDGDGMRLRFDPSARIAFDWPAGFGVVHEFRLDGEAVAWREGQGWTVRTPGLAVAGTDLSLRARGGIAFPNDGGRPHLDLAADIDDARVAAAHGFWIHHLMPAATVDWLDAALQGGNLRDIHAVVAGDLDDWPFGSGPAGAGGAGRFRIDARMQGGRLKFQPDWPAMEQVDGDIRFEADGFTIAGKGRLGAVPVTSFKAGIPRFGRAELTVDAEAAGNAADFLAMLRQSPLRKDHGETMDHLQVSGPATADFHMVLPFHHDPGARMRLQGSATLAGARLREDRWKLAFEQVRGQLRYDQDGFLAEALQVRHEGAPGVLSLRAGPHVRDPGQAFEAALQASIGIDDLLDKAGNLGWLKPYVGGRSPWTVAVAIPRGTTQAPAPTRLQLRSNLVGTTLELPQPVRKPAGEAMAATVDLSLPLERGEVAVQLGSLLAVRSRSTPQQTGVRVQFGGAAAEPPVHGLVVGGRVDRVDALDWIGVFAGDRDASGLPLRRIEVEARQLRLLGADFADARLVLAPAPRGTAVQVHAPGIAGALMIPDQDGATVAGRFERLHWKLPGGGGLAGAVGATRAAAARADPPAAPAPGGATAFDPARVPPLLFEVGDLRLGEAALGQARFRSTPAAGGLRMDEFSTRGGKQRLSANGSWTGKGASARTRLALGVDSDDIGALLAGLSLGGQVGGGEGKLQVEAEWRGGPEDFDPKSIEASLALDARDGRLLELEPGAGRVLGLLGIGQLPRRLTLDFRDFFDKGFAFDRIHGSVRLAQGTARSDDLAIEGPAADILVRGSADLRTQRFDQTVEVLPKSGGLLTAVGAIAGGPVGAAVGAMANAVLDKPLQGLGAKTYRITGPWSSPKVEVNARTPAARAGRAATEKPPG